jgi:5,10-methylenetetrahydromethanopterin reductase
MRLSVSATPQSWSTTKHPHQTALKTIEAARRADEAGFDTFWVSEDPDGWDAMAMLSAIAVQTERIRLGTSVVNPFFRHPSLIAASISTLDRLSNGRARLGLGRGQTEWYERGLGMDVSRPLGRLEETMRLLRQWWSGDHDAHSDGPFHVQGWKRGFGPIQADLPIYIAAVGDKAVALAGRQADGLIFNDLASVHGISTIISDVRRSAKDAGRDAARLTFIARPRIVITNDPDPVYETIKDGIAMIYTLPGMGKLIATENFDTEEILGRVRKVMRTEEVLRQGGAFRDMRTIGDLPAARKLIPSEMVAQLSFVGTIEEIRPRIQVYEAIGVSEIAWRLRDIDKSNDWDNAALLLGK